MSSPLVCVAARKRLFTLVIVEKIQPSLGGCGLCQMASSIVKLVKAYASHRRVKYTVNPASGLAVDAVSHLQRASASAKLMHKQKNDGGSNHD